MTAVAERLTEATQKASTGMLVLVGSAIPLTIFLVMQLFHDPSLFLQTLMKSLGLGATYAIIALGFVLIFKATQTINFAQGSLAVAGALFLSFMVADDHIPLTTIANPLNDVGGPEWIGWILSVFVALFFAALLGLVIERLAIRPMIGQPLFSVAMITLGLEIMLRTANNDTSETEFRSLRVPWGIDGFRVGDAFINWSYIAAIVTAAVAFLAVYFFYRSRLGIAMRAVAFDQEAAMAQGINVGRVFAIAWAAGAVLAAIGGIFGSQPPVRQTGAIDPETANIAFRALPAVVLGGLDSATGALLGGVIIGLAEIFAGQYAVGLVDEIGAGYPLVIPYVVMLIGLIVRPYGLFGTPEIRRV
ncbi:branched-chain amino acid ABC transporter permease [Acidimicrobiaceae bacterium AH-315-P05]|nr:branched-chain amino acid ABC transporter permease [Acidimicrobiaceae bacterium AH-315-P05]